MNVIDPQRRLLVIQLLIAGFSCREVAARAHTNKVTVMSYMHRIGMKRTNGHRTPRKLYHHRNQCTEWWQEHYPANSQFNEDLVLALNKQILAELTAAPQFPALDAEQLEWKRGKEILLEIRRALKERTNRQPQAGHLP